MWRWRQRPITIISCIKILPSWPNEAKNSRVLRLLISVPRTGQSAPWPRPLCRLASGGSFAVRRLYTDEDEVLFEAARHSQRHRECHHRPDLADRALFLTLPSISDARRRPEIELWREFELARPRLLGALLDAVSHGLQVLPAAAWETALWPSGIVHARPTRPTAALPVGRLRARAHGRARLLEGQRRRPAAYRRRSQQRRHREGWHRLSRPAGR